MKRHARNLEGGHGSPGYACEQKQMSIQLLDRAHRIAATVRISRKR